MSRPSELSGLSPAARAELIYGTARRQSDAALWRSALGLEQERQPGPGPAAERPLLDLGVLVEALMGSPSPAPGGRMEGMPAGELRLGPNARHAAAIASAAARTGLPGAAIAAIVDAEAAKGPGGVWKADSRNPRSSAAGLGQFLSGTWIGEAERPGTFLHHLATERGWLDGRGRVRAEARGDLLALRFDPAVSIQATADYARGNLDRLERQGVRVGSGVEEVARAAYLAHHLGPGDALRYSKDGLGSGRAATLLAAQVGENAAARRIAAAGDAAAAHRAWLDQYVGRHVRPSEFLA